MAKDFSQHDDAVTEQVDAYGLWKSADMACFTRKETVLVSLITVEASVGRQVDLAWPLKTE